MEPRDEDRESSPDVVVRLVAILFGFRRVLCCAKPEGYLSRINQQLVPISAKLHDRTCGCSRIHVSEFAANCGGVLFTEPKPEAANPEICAKHAWCNACLHTRLRNDRSFVKLDCVSERGIKLQFHLLSNLSIRLLSANYRVKRADAHFDVSPNVIRLCSLFLGLPHISF